MSLYFITLRLGKIRKAVAPVSKISCFCLLVSTLLFAQEYQLNSLRYEFGSKSYDNSFFNENLSFYSSSQSFTSSAKILGELLTGTAAGYGGAMLIKNLFRYDMREAELGNIIQLTLIALGAMYGNTAGVYLFGRIIGDEGSLSNTFLWSMIGSVVFYNAARFLTDDPDKRIFSAAAGLPVGAVIGFNSNHIGEIISNLIYP